MNVVCIEDDQLALKTLVKILKNFKEIDNVIGFDNNFENSIECVQNKKIDIAIFDVNLQYPKCDGVDLAIKIHEISPSTYIVFTSKYGDAEERIQAGIGEVDYLEKPWTQKIIETKITNIITYLQNNRR